MAKRIRQTKHEKTTNEISADVKQALSDLADVRDAIDDAKKKLSRVNKRDRSFLAAFASTVVLAAAALLSNLKTQTNDRAPEKGSSVHIEAGDIGDAVGLQKVFVELDSENKTNTAATSQRNPWAGPGISAKIMDLNTQTDGLENTAVNNVIADELDNLLDVKSRSSENRTLYQDDNGRFESETIESNGEQVANRQLVIYNDGTVHHTITEGNTRFDYIFFTNGAGDMSGDYMLRHKDLTTGDKVEMWNDGIAYKNGYEDANPSLDDFRSAAFPEVIDNLKKAESEKSLDVSLLKGMQSKDR